MAALMFSLLIGLILLGMPVAFSLGIISTSWVMIAGRGIRIVAARVYDGMDSFTLLAVPFFILAGEIMNKSGITERLIRFVNFIVGRVPGGLAQANIYTSVLFAGISGAAISDASALGTVFIPAMEKEGYSRSFSAMVTAASAIVGPIIPPSIMMIIYSGVTGISVGALFAAGFIPGMMLALGMSILTYFYALKRKYPKHEVAFTLKEFLLYFKDAFLALMTPVIIIGGILFGVFTPTEAAAVTVFYALVLGVFVYRKVKPRDILDAMKNTIRVSSMLLFIIGVAMIFGWITARLRIHRLVLEALLTLTTDPALLMFIVIGIFVFVGTWLEPAVSIAILVPLMLPVMEQIGVHPLHFAIVTIVTLCVGLITPPLGTVLYGVVAVGKIKFEKVVREIWPYLLVDFAVILILAYSPQVTLFLPRLLGFI